MINKYKNPKSLQILIITLSCLTLALLLVSKRFSSSSNQATQNKMIESQTKDEQSQVITHANTSLLKIQEFFKGSTENLPKKQLQENTTPIDNTQKNPSQPLSPSVNMPSSEINPSHSLTTSTNMNVSLNPKISSQTSIATPEPIPSETPKVSQRTILQGCFSMNYSHKKMSSHADGEACLKHNNLITIQFPNQIELQEKLNQKSVCILVNGSPVQHTLVQGRTNQFLIGPVAGPNSQITARFCLGKAQCAENCVVKKDTFMSALGLDEELGESKVGWDGSKESSKEDIELEAEVAALDKEKGQSDTKSNNTFTGWIADNYTAACNATSASKTNSVKTISLK